MINSATVINNITPLKVVILLSDGANVSYNPNDIYYYGYTDSQIVTLSKQLNMYKIIIDTVGLGAGPKGESLLQKMASAGKGEYYSLNSSSDIDGVYSNTNFP